MTRRSPVAPEPPASWPPDIRAAWAAGLARERWDGAFAKAIAAAYARWRSFAAGRPAGESEPARGAAYEAALRDRLAPASVIHYLDHLFYALQTLDPDAERLWLLSRRRALREQRRPSKPRRPPAARRRRFSLARADWPEDLRRRWDAARAVAAPGARRYRNRQTGPAAAWSKAYAVRIARGYGYYLHLASVEGFAPEPSPAAIDRFCEITEPRVASVSLSSYVWEIYEAARLLFPDGDWAWLRGDAAFLKAKAKPSRNKVGRLAKVSELRALAMTRLKEAEVQAPRPAVACDHRDALMLALLTYKPARRRNLFALRWGIELQLHAQGASLHFAETKNGDPDGHPLPAAMADHLRRHWERYRPMLLGAADTDHLWLSSKGGPLSADAITLIIGDLTERHLQRRIPPHLFRDCVATSMAERGADMIEAIPVLLGHRDPRSSLPYRKHAQTIEAARQLAAVIDAAR